MRIRRTSLAMLALVLATALAFAQGDAVRLDTPFIQQADYHDDLFFFGRVRLAARLTDPALGQDKQAFYSINGGATFEPAQVHGAIPAVRVNETTSAEQIDPVIAPLAGGGLVVAWGGYRAATSFDIYVRRYDAAGAPLGGEVLVPTWTAASQVQAAVAGLADGGFVVAWASWAEDGAGYGVYAQRFGADGARAGPVLQVNEVTAGNQMDPAVAPLPDGGFVVAWQSGNSGAYDILVRRYDASGAPLGSGFMVNDDAVGDEVDPMVASFTNGGWVVAWTERGAAPRGDDVHAKLFPAGYAPRPADPNAPRQFKLSQAVDGHQRTPSVAARPAGGFVAVWVDSTLDGSGFGIYGQSFDATGLPLVRGGTGAPIDLELHTQRLGNQVSPRIVSLGEEDGHLVTWADQQTTNQSRVKARRLDEDFALVGGELLISESAANHVTPAPVGLGDGVFAISWAAFGDVLDTSRGGVLLRRMGEVLLVAPELEPGRDITVVFRAEQPSTGQVWTSQARLYRYGDPSLGATGRVLYPVGYTRAPTVEVGIERPETPFGYVSNELYARGAPLTMGVCGAFTEWQRVAQPSVLVSQIEVALEDARCVQFKWRVRTGAGRDFEYTSEGVLRTDRTVPQVSVTHTQAGGVLAVTVQVVEATSPVISRGVSHNGAAPVPFTGDVALVPLMDGGNRVRIDVMDAAGNVGQAGFFVSADLTPARIDIYTLEEGGTYGRDIPLGYTLTRPLSGLTLTLDGEVRPLGDLLGLADGLHTLIMRGITEDGQEIRTKVRFTVAADAFQLQLLSPQARTYAEDRVTVTWEASGALAQRSIVLDGVRQEGTTLEALADGEHTLVFTGTSASGQSVTITRHFRVELAVPRLEVLAPADGAVVPGREVALQFEANGPVTYAVGGTTGSVVPGQTIALPSDGLNALTLTTHLPNGASTSRVVTVNADALVPQVTVSSPAPRLYAFRSMPITWASNKTLRDVTYWLDGHEVTQLEGLTNGPHRFEFTGRDHAGRPVRAVVDFQVAHLEILSPRPGEEVLDNDFPPQVDLTYQAGGGFTTLSASVDGGERLLLPALEGTYPLQMSGGPHEVTVVGEVAGQILARRVDFRVGSLNVRAGRQALRYAYENCDAKLECDVTATLRVDNVGEFDVIEPFSVALQVSSPLRGTRTHLWELAGLARGETATRALGPFRARLEERFRLTVDPEGALLGEDGRDNVHEVIFQPGRIAHVTPTLSSENFYVHGARVDNVFIVSTAGAVDFVELEAAGVYFRDNTDGQGFVVPVDMGLLTPERNWVVVRAYDADNRLLDTTRRYFDVRRLPTRLPYKAPPSPWLAFLGAGNRVVVDTVDQRALAHAELTRMHEAMALSALTVYPTDAGRDAEGLARVQYGMLSSDGPTLANKRGDQQAIGALTSLNFSRGDCLVQGFAPISETEAQKKKVSAVFERWEDLLNSVSDMFLEPKLDEELDKLAVKLEEADGLHLYGFSKALTLGLGGVGESPLGIPLVSAWGGVVGLLDIVPPKVGDLNFDFTDEVNRFELRLESSRCLVRLSGVNVVLDSEVAFTMAYLRSMALSADLEGGASGFVLGAAGVNVPLLELGAFAVALAYADLDLYDVRFTGRLYVKSSYRGELTGSALQPALVLRDSSVELAMRFPFQRQRVANLETYGAALASVLGLPSAAVGLAWVDLDLDLQQDASLRHGMSMPLSLSNPAFEQGELPDSEEALRLEGRIFSKVDLRTNGFTLGCGVAVVVPFCWYERLDSERTVGFACKETNAEGQFVDLAPDKCPIAPREPLNPAPLPPAAPL